MEQRSFCWISDMGLDDAAASTMQQEFMGTMNQSSTQQLISATYDNDIKQCISSSEGLTLYPFAYSMEKLIEAASSQAEGAYKWEQQSMAPLLLSFSQKQEAHDVTKSSVRRKEGFVNGENKLKKMKYMGLERSASCGIDHIVAERRRRERLSQRFIALAAIIPGLKKMDKISVLGDAIMHIKELEKRVKILEEKVERKTVEIATMNVKPTKGCESHPIRCMENSNITLINGSSSFEQKMQHHDEIDIKLCDKQVLVKLLCENQKGVLTNLLSRIEELRLLVCSLSVVPFMGSTFMDIIVAAQVEDGNSITVEDISKKLTSTQRLTKC